jgi:hypothetical protein
VLDHTQQDVVAEIKRLTCGGADVAIEALGTSNTFESCLRSVRAGGTVSSLGVYSGHLQVPLETIAAGLGDHTIVTTLCPGGKERMRRLMSVVKAKRLPFRDLVTHTFSVDQIEEAYELFAHQRNGLMKVAIRPVSSRRAPTPELGWARHRCCSTVVMPTRSEQFRAIPNAPAPLPQRARRARRGRSARCFSRNGGLA